MNDTDNYNEKVIVKALEGGPLGNKIYKERNPVQIVYCQREIEMNPECEKQCDHCKKYYAPLVKDKMLEHEEVEKKLRTFKFGGCRIEGCNCYESNLFPCENPKLTLEAVITFDKQGVIITNVLD